MDFLLSDSEELDDDMLILCSDLKIQVPTKKQKILPPREELQPLSSSVEVSPPLEATQPPENDIEETFLPSVPSACLNEEVQPLSTTAGNSPSLLEQLPSDSEIEDKNSNRKRKSKGFAQPKKWNKNTIKLKRMQGEEYVGYRRDRKVSGQEKFNVLHDVPRPARSIGSRCTSTFCSKSKLRGCFSLSDIERENIFGKFWKSMTWEQWKQYVVSHVSVCEKKQVKVKSNSRRRESKQYFLSTRVRLRGTYPSLSEDFFEHSGFERVDYKMLD
ncbi:unnamed protein product [Parnassius apollo]|uniref:(apollo) hypothetical protein n=1 Tax=Parnassius apollo TaxID=110799 RepID=A0A8S3XNR1_PARAO|nr:unnamed protein product [Parnassius apollo]